MSLKNANAKHKQDCFTTEIVLADVFQSLVDEVHAAQGLRRQSQEQMFYNIETTWQQHRNDKK